uniref:C2H2-type domain-containing protein n=1 Tax=Trichogramma kaykai TaxID=54128 RepID=A0ABD2XMA7_9HYME
MRLESNGLQTSPSLPCDLCSKQFKNEESLRKHRNKVHFNRGDNQMMMQQHQQQQQQTLSGGEEEAGQSPGIMETLFKQEFSIDDAEIAFTNKQRSSSSSVNGDKQQRLFLVMNPEAFCELCCKEYVDRHHLHAHRLKRHAEGKSQNSSTETQQESPLNLIMADSSLNNGSALDTDEAEEYACKMCGLRLQTQELFLLHVDKIHRSSSPRNLMLVGDDDSIENQQKTLTTTTEDAMMISEDLKKLQTMITQLSGLESNKAASCALCGKDYDNPAELRSHMIAEHGVVPENLASHVGAALTSIPQQQPRGGKVEEQQHQSTTPTSSTTPQLVAAPISPMTPKSNSSQSMQDNPRNKSTTTSSTTATPTGNQVAAAVAAAQQINSSFCTLCNKELCNKYFMKTHMQKMHGIEIENGAQIGGVVCNICKKELCSKYFLRVHKQNTHGITEDGQQTTTTTTTATGNKQQETMESPGAGAQQGVEDLALKPELLGDLNLRYITHFTEVCPICNRRFRSSKWLKLHLKEHAPPELDKWREMEQSQKTPNKSSSKSISSSPSSSLYSAASLPSLKIPNGGFESANNSASNFMRADLAALGNQVLSNFFGDQQQQQGQQQQQQQQNYCCSQPQCNFSTTILPLYFLHERSHHQEMDEQQQQQRMLQCPICAQSFGQLEALREHVSARHPNPFPGLLSSLPLPLLGDFAMPPNSSEQQQRTTTIKSEDCPRTSPSAAATVTPQQQHIMNEIDTNQMIKQEESSGGGSNNVVQVMPQGAYKCSQCGFASSNLNRIKKHVRKDHRCPGGADPVEQALAELNKMLKDVANKHKVPVSYAVPQLPPSQQQDNNGINNSSESSKTVMQAFIVEEKPQQEKTQQQQQQQQSNGGSNGCGDNEEDDASSYRAKRFAPALVFLPVKARVSDSLTLTFSLSPA